MLQKLLLIKSDWKTEEALRKVLNEHGFSVNVMPLDSLVANLAQESKEKEGTLMKCGDIEINEDEMVAKMYGDKLALTPQEFKLLRYFVANQGRLLSREMILSRVWGYNSEATTRVIDVYVGYLKKKIGKDYLRTQRGFGYVMEVPIYEQE